MDKVEKAAIREQFKLIICGASAYSRDWDYLRFRAIADNGRRFTIGKYCPSSRNDRYRFTQQSNGTLSYCYLYYS